MKILKILLTLVLISNLVLKSNQNIKLSDSIQELDKETKIALEKYFEYNKHIQEKKIKVNIVEEISNLKFAKTTESFWEVFKIVQNIGLIEISHGLAREYIKKIGMPLT